MQNSQFNLSKLMQESKSYSKSQLYFSRWSRKSYAIFSSLSREVRISRLSVDMCGKALLKLNKFSMFFYEKFDYLFNAIDMPSIKKMDISDLIAETFQLLNNRDLKVRPMVAFNNSINKDFKDNS